MQRPRLILALCLAALLAGLARFGPSAWPAQAGPAGTQQVFFPYIRRPPLPVFMPLLVRSTPQPTVDVWVSRVALLQATTPSSGYSVSVAHRPALLRVFVGVAGTGAVDGVRARLTRYVGGAPQDSLFAGPITAHAAPYEGDLGHTLNFNLPGHWLAPGTEYVVELDPDGALTEVHEDNNRFPAGGQQAFNFVDAPALEVVIVPVRYARPGGTVTLPNTSSLDYVTWLPYRVYPVSQINYSVRPASLTFTGDLREASGWFALLDAITALHAAEDLSEHKVYYGLVESVAADGCSGGCIVGAGWVNSPPPHGFISKSAVGFAGFPGNRNEASPTLTHEMGHNFGRYHAPCGAVSGLGYFPYDQAAIGQWGYDVATGSLYHPNNYRDFMSYCAPEWVSDYTFHGLYQAWSWATHPYGLAGGGADAAPAEAAPSLTGFVLEGSQVVAGPVFLGPSRLPEADEAGAWRLQVLDAAGQAIAERRFDPVPVAVDGDAAGAMAHGFRLTVPPAAGMAGLRLLDDAGRVVFERLAAGPAPALGPAAASRALDSGGAEVAWTLAAGHAPGARYRVRFSPDGGRTWQLLAPNTGVPRIEVPAGLLASAAQPVLDVQVSDGVRVGRGLWRLAGGTWQRVEAAELKP